jgi:hydroxyethylthiazole kinase
MALAGQAVRTKGVDSTRAADEARDAARALAGETGGTVAATGKVDYVTDGRRALAVANGHPLMTKVTALGCTATSIVGACLAVEGDALHATAHALAVVGVCGERAARGEPGPGTFRVRFMDALAELDGPALERAARIAEA